VIGRRRGAPDGGRSEALQIATSHAPIDEVGTFWFDATPQATASDDYSQTLRDEVHQALDTPTRGSH
jgi:hypothetical protein